MPSGQSVFAGHPKLVSTSSIDNRVTSWYEGKLVNDQVVAFALGVYTPHNPNVPDLNDYLSGPVDGDCAAIKKFFPGVGSTCQTGVQ